jgi:hypothetical protein
LARCCGHARPPGRELRALAAAGKKRRRAVRRLLVLDRDSMPQMEIPGVRAEPAYEWLLGASGDD